MIPITGMFSLIVASRTVRTLLSKISQATTTKQARMRPIAAADNLFFQASSLASLVLVYVTAESSVFTASVLRILSISVAYDSAMASAISIDIAGSAVVAENVMMVAELFMKFVVALDDDDLVPDVYTETEF